MGMKLRRCSAEGYLPRRMRVLRRAVGCYHNRNPQPIWLVAIVLSIWRSPHELRALNGQPSLLASREQLAGCGGRPQLLQGPASG